MGVNVAAGRRVLVGVGVVVFPVGVGVNVGAGILQASTNRITRMDKSIFRCFIRLLAYEISSYTAGNEK
jgi:hypothetical protein